MTETSQKAPAIARGNTDHARVKAECEGVFGRLISKLLYGENRRQKKAGFYLEPKGESDELALDKFMRIEGDLPSYINMTDLHRLVETATRLGASMERNFQTNPYLAIAVKHGNACGAAIGDDPTEVLQKMVIGDPEAISGGFVLVNFEIDETLARELRTWGMPSGQTRILDGVIAPSFTNGAIEALARKTGKCRLFVNPALSTGLDEDSIDSTARQTQVRGGFLMQEGDPYVFELPPEWKTSLSRADQEDIVLSWALSATSNSNTITLVKEGMLIGAGMGQRSRKMAAKIAVLYATEYGHRTKGAIACSDSFFPFPDGVQVLIKAGVKIIFATSGSIRDKEVQEVCTKAGVRLLQLPDEVARGFYGHG